MQIITGMHRSGTSLVARLLLEAGCNFGEAATFYPGDRWNTDGYFEQCDVQRTNRSLTEGWWWKFAYFRLPSETTILRRSRNLESQIRRLAEKYENTVLKETRFCLTLPAWRAFGTSIDRPGGLLAASRRSGAFATPPQTAFRCGTASGCG